MAKYYIGLMSGTSADGIDLALVEFSHSQQATLIASHYVPYEQALTDEITSLYCPSNNEIDRAHALDKKLAFKFANAIEQLLSNNSLNSNDIIAIGNHGQTIRHRPASNESEITEAFTLQIGCSQTLACLTGIQVIGQFRIKDMALGGQGAPLVPAFHQFIVPQDAIDNIVVNIGGIANISYLPKEKSGIQGFDTGPGNCLMDEWYSLHNQGNYDESGEWAAKGNVIPDLLANMLKEPYFKRPAPKSTGREVFNLNWLRQLINQHSYQAVDIQATLTTLTAITIAHQIKQLTPKASVWLCGGGRHNQTLVKVLSSELPNMNVASTKVLGIDGDALEAIAFAWLAYAYKNNIHSNIPAVTGAAKSTTLGVLFTP
ncbi:anhydro-N-acetylmuramic acid kinase [Thalassotalea sp. M1531]|uniref:Anhydro-N-acetylmuramic acid kinase n=1 Tax=Thalassotalea algicola TaxID=2716224 RepID=A0A7Y0LC39_9GAMM|nr:anhydro-N-acetylmuramic acid kinase [Thalassotalea algicola]NMP30355.1 anhydro-N-acetylmuramic acid kinase [Thalassotalea algicola]